MNSELFDGIQWVIRKSPVSWLSATCEVLRSVPPTATVDFIKKRLPETNNADLSAHLSEVITLSEGSMSWDALGWSIQLAADTYTRLTAERHVELLWSGPMPNEQIPARRFDQALYDLIAHAEREILLVTYAAAKIQRLTDQLLKAIERGVKVRLVLEFAEASEGQLSFDALNAFPANLVESAEVYYWPVENRARNQAGKPGKLHAKLAVIDNAVLVSSANLTDDAFTRNLELGVKLTDPDLVQRVQDHIQGLIRDATLRHVKVTVQGHKILTPQGRERNLTT